MKRATNVPYSNYLTYVGIPPRPFASVQLVKGLLKSAICTCLVDSGADYLVLPLPIATPIGIVPTGPLVSIGTVGGPLSVYQESGVSVEIEGVAVNVTVLLDPSGTAPMIVGREALLAMCEFGFNVSEWLWG